VHARRAKGTRERGRVGSWFGHRDGDSRADRVIHCECRILKAAWQRVANKVQGDGSGGRRVPSFVAPFVWAAVMSVGTILTVVTVIWLMLQ
jgi:hypothetical protein